MSKPKKYGYYLYTVYDNRTDFPVIIDGTSRQCAEVMGIKYESFHRICHMTKIGKTRRWTILKGEFVSRNNCMLGGEDSEVA